MEKIIVPAPAKINLALDIIGKRDDGFHEVEMIMQSISLHDIIEIERTNKGIHIEVYNSDLPTDENNIAYRAAELMLKEKDVSTGVSIKIKKDIPVAAGLAGGSTDAAAVLTGLNILYGLHFSREELYAIGAKIGSDVPFCIDGGTALAYGRGEKIKQLPDIEERYIVLVNPGIEISTPWAYNRFASTKIDKKINIKKLSRIIIDKKKIDWNEGWQNVMESLVFPVYKEIEEIKGYLKEIGANHSLMSGSGSSVFGIFEDRKKAEKAIRKWPRSDDFITLTKTVKKGFYELWRN
ncbi:MAG: 4-(cytidine 5'-diphospho)-2-C-methyl-D-erythritol kinase [Halothermotrichaceae bacterium]